MESRSAGDDREKLKKWHAFLTGDHVGGQFGIVQECRDKAGQWLVEVDLRWASGKDLPEPMAISFLVQQLDQYRFAVAGIKFDRPDGCPGDSQPSTAKPTLFPDGGN